jgi:hypothetical protein
LKAVKRLTGKLLMDNIEARSKISIEGNPPVLIYYSSSGLEERTINDREARQLQGFHYLLRPTCAWVLSNVNEIKSNNIVQVSTDRHKSLFDRNKGDGTT